MDLNISTEILNNFSNLIDLQDINKGSSVFQDILNDSINLGDLIDLKEDLNLEIEKDDDDLIDDELLQSMLINLKTIDFEEFVKIKDNISLNLEQFTKNNDGFTKLSDKEVEVLGKLNKLLDEIKTDKNFSIDIKDFEVKQKAFTLIKEELKELKESNADIKLSDKKPLERSDHKNLSLDMKEELYKLESYDKFEVSSLYNKKNILKSNVDSSSNNKDLKTLENILDKDDNNFIMQSSNLHPANLNIKKDISLRELPVNNIRQEFISEDIIKTVKYLKSNNMEEINIKISPRELGDMTIKLVKSPEETKVLITISKEDVFELVHKNTQDIVKHLTDANIKIKEVVVDIKSNNDKFFSSNLNQEFSRRNQENKKRRNKYEASSIEEIDTIKEDNIDEDNINILI
ncbi:flagellar hook-length control protein FliK [Clostridium sp. CCUG 7971]|uniref:flagellar hook-length control protein FliK n=1 Tax=Clostridium sp. CCUG 7971 TaxID=2811414 RepID=UPI001ABB66BC|nr:flagellar hook-length control protein FliK [Clostridium sp. CCUG 7971]MBO3445072.1 flagellar hook-length control protein FliK [Clostridium sp. CCUG 7971]